MLIHVSLKTRKASEPAAQVTEKLQRIATAHAVLERPEGLGRSVGRK
jgi:carnitine 3-dehydrogenase